jgi:hypothetical protein
VVGEPGYFTDGIGSFASIRQPGGPSATLVDPDFPNAPMASTPTGSRPHPVDAPIQFSLPAGGSSYDVVASSILGAGDRVIGFVVVADDGGKAHVPVLPSGSDRAAPLRAGDEVPVFAGRHRRRHRGGSPLSSRACSAVIP